MILRSIEVEGWRCFASPILVGPFDPGLNIIHGPNGIGKSSLMMALARGLFDNHNVGGADIKNLRSWGRQLAPKVTIEFEQNDDRFQLHKQFLDSASAKLTRKENGRFVPVAESRAADDRAREILSGEASARGASDQRHWGLAQILWATQGSLRIDDLTSGTRATIQDALGAQLVGPSTEAMEQRIADCYGRFFTSKGRLKSGASAPAMVGLESQLEKERAVQIERQNRLREFETASRRIEDLGVQAKTARSGEQELDNNLKKIRSEVQAYQVLIGEKKQLQVEVSAATESYRNLSDRIESIRVADKELADIAIELNRLRDDSPTLEKWVSQCQSNAKLTGQNVKTIRGRRVEVAAARLRAQLAERCVRNRQIVVDLEKRLNQIEGTDDAIKQVRVSRDQIVAPDQKTLKQIAKVARQRDDARLRLDAALVTVSIRLQSDAEIEITSAEQTGSRAIAKNSEHQIKGAPDVAFHIPGVGTIRAIGPTDDFEELRGQWISSEARFGELTAGFGTRELASLESLHAQADELDRQIVQLEIKLATLLDSEDRNSLRADRAQAQNTLDEIYREQPDWKEAPPNPTEFSRRADEIENRVSVELANAESADEQAREALQRASRKRDDQSSRITSVEASAAALRTRLESLRNDGLPDRVRGERLTEVALKREAAAGKLAQIEDRIKEMGEDPTKMLARLEEQQKGFRAEADEAEKKLNTESGRLQQIISEAPYSALAEVEEEIDRLEQEIARQALLMQAVRLLHETVVQQKSEVVQSLVDPIRQRANLILQRIAGSQFDGVQFNELFLPTGIAPRSHDETVMLDQISGGEQEQVHFAVRMALADVAFPNDRQLVVLDDVFTYTDAPRLARIANILAESAERFQIVLLTCHPERYRGLPNAKFFDLEKIATG